MIEPIDEVAIQNLQTYKEKKFVDISKEDLELGWCRFSIYTFLKHVKQWLFLPVASIYMLLKKIFKIVR